MTHLLSTPSSHMICKCRLVWPTTPCIIISASAPHLARCANLSPHSEHTKLCQERMCLHATPGRWRRLMWRGWRLKLLQHCQALGPCLDLRGILASFEGQWHSLHLLVAKRWLQHQSTCVLPQSLTPCSIDVLPVSASFLFLFFISIFYLFSFIFYFYIVFKFILWWPLVMPSGFLFFDTFTSFLPFVTGKHRWFRMFFCKWCPGWTEFLAHLTHHTWGRCINQWHSELAPLMSWATLLTLTFCEFSSWHHKAHALQGWCVDCTRAPAHHGLNNTKNMEIMSKCSW